MFALSRSMIEQPPSPPCAQLQVILLSPICRLIRGGARAGQVRWTEGGGRHTPLKQRERRFYYKAITQDTSGLQIRSFHDPERTLGRGGPIPRYIPAAAVVSLDVWGDGTPRAGARACREGRAGRRRASPPLRPPSKAKIKRLILSRMWRRDAWRDGGRHLSRTEASSPNFPPGEVSTHTCLYRCESLATQRAACGAPAS
jgi:hypothetical protein